MTSSWLYNPLVSSLPDHCEPSSAFLTFISSRLHTCIPTPLALVSSTLGILSIVSWLFAQLPQIYKNYKVQSTCGLSIWFLIEWCLGDATNLLGAILLRQAGWQITVASYYVFVDVALVIQYYFYTYLKDWRLRRRGGYMQVSDPGFSDGDMYNGIVPTEENTILGLSPTSILPSEPKTVTSKKDLGVDTPLGSSLSRPNEKQRSPRIIYRVGGSSSITPSSSPRTIVFLSMLCVVLANAAATSPSGQNAPIFTPSQTDARKVAGKISSWSSTILYLASRIPQLYKNYGRKSTSGLSPLLFFAAFCGNFFYSSSLLTNPNAWSDLPAYGGGGWVGKEGNSRLEWIGRAIPFFLGAFGVLGMDGAMGIQFMIYTKKNEDVDAATDLQPAGPGQGRGSWRRVSGWMKGWVPSASPELKSPSVETEALMVDGQYRYGAV
ncbi:PQ loop repeat protein [Histoplasma capsulatum G186AR]|uniref:PQ loop repeat protein n=2 Tax=Ajellomyces capsulatus TaxID=5037 RepID=C0NXY7_AJECG|nr:PQ loop repeat protein [Histoplasma capsulatum G186AR]EEH03655.1 PQ loop repeat protein [Histoplasma capsulatum G186AR]KAG5293768.1 PQ loop repeat protein [Histoplasma capsulatum]QSS75220.1 PQ loop repeat protein [Histoplasma capsulatum G186AR]